MNGKYLPDTFFQLLNPDNTSSYNRYIAHAIGAIETIIYFSLISKMTYYFKNGMLDDEGFFYATALDIQESTTFTKRQQMPAISKLVEIGLIETKNAGIPKKKYFKVLNKQELIMQLIEQGEAKAESIRNSRKKADKNQKLQNVTSCSSSENDEDNADKPHKTQKLQNVTSCSDKMSRQGETKCHHCELQNVTSCSDKMSHKSKEINYSNNLNNINQSITDECEAQLTMEDVEFPIDVIDRKSHLKDNSLYSERKAYEKIIKENIDYEGYKQGGGYRAELIEAMYAIIIDSVCSTQSTIRVNKNESPQETVKSTFLKLDSRHIEYVFEMLEEYTPDMKNIQAYLRTALYNAVSSEGMYYTSKLKAAGVI